MNAGHPPLTLWGSSGPRWLESTGPLISPVVTGVTWKVAAAPMPRGDHLLLFTDGIWELLADDEGRAERRFTTAIERAPDGGAVLLEKILGEVNHELAGRAQADDLTLLTATVGR